jgi:hypothetical protein
MFISITPHKNMNNCCVDTRIDYLGNIQKIISYDQNGNISKKEYQLCRNSRSGWPSIVWNYETGSVNEVAWYSYGYLHRINGPAVVLYNIGGKIREEWWYRLGIPYRVSGPAISTYWENGNIRKEVWCKHGREDIILYHKKTSKF